MFKTVVSPKEDNVSINKKLKKPKEGTVLITKQITLTLHNDKCYIIGLQISNVFSSLHNYINKYVTCYHFNSTRQILSSVDDRC